MCLTDFGMGGGRSEYRNKHYLCIRNKGRKPPQKGEKKAFTVFLEKTVSCCISRRLYKQPSLRQSYYFFTIPGSFRAFFPPPGSTFQQPCDDFVRGIHRTVIQFVQIDLGRSFGRVPQTDADDRDRDTLFAGKARPAMPRNVEREFDRKIQAFAHIPEKAQVVGQAVFITQIEFLVEQPAFVRRRSIIHERRSRPSAPNSSSTGKAQGEHVSR